MNNRLYQQGTHDCGAAVLAMALGLKNAMAAYPFLGYDPSAVAPLGVTDYELSTILNNTGRRTEFFVSREMVAKGWNMHVEDLQDRKHIPTEHTLRQLLGASQQGCQIVSVPSLNNEGDTHFVFCRRGEVHDPSNLRQYIGSAQSLPVQSVIFITEEP